MYVSLISMMAAAGALLAVGAMAAPRSALPLADNSPTAVPVDVELVLAVDVSYSMDPEEQALQREGYIAGITSREFMQALRSGHHGQVAVTYFEWAGPYDQKIVVPWRLFDGSGYKGFRRVVDVSGDGANNSGTFVTLARDDVLAAGMTINGLPIMLKRPNAFTMDIDNLDIYYEDCVIGGPGAFVVPIREREQFKEATRTKLVLEIAGRTPQRRLVPVQARAPRISCTIGEQMWRDRWGN